MVILPVAIAIPLGMVQTIPSPDARFPSSRPAGFDAGERALQRAGRQ